MLSVQHSPCACADVCYSQVRVLRGNVRMREISKYLAPKEMLEVDTKYQGIVMPVTSR
jgi:hypothetical protein